MITNQKNSFPYLGYGVGLRAEQFDRFAIIIENFLVSGGKLHYYLDPSGVSETINYSSVNV